MKVEFTQNAEIFRIQEQTKTRKAPWEIYKTSSLVDAVHRARDAGWKEKKIQVRAEQAGEDIFEYYIEPFEKDCGCRGILMYGDFFD